MKRVRACVCVRVRVPVRVCVLFTVRVFQQRREHSRVVKDRDLFAPKLIHPVL